MRTSLLLLAVLFVQHYIQAQKPQLIVPTGHKGKIEQAGFSPDNRLVYTYSSNSNLIKIWEAQSARLLFNLKDTGGYYLNMDDIGFARGGRYVYGRISKANGTQDADFLGQFIYKIWDLTTGKYLKDVENYYCLGKPFTPGLEYSVMQDSSFQLYKAVHGTEKMIPLKRYDEKIICYQYHPSINQVLVATAGRIDLWNLDKDQLLWSLPVTGNGQLYEARINWENQLLTVIAEKAVMVYTAHNGGLVYRASTASGPVIKAETDARGKFLLLMSREGLVAHDIKQKKKIIAPFESNKTFQEDLVDSYGNVFEIYTKEDPWIYLRWLTVDKQFTELFRDNSLQYIFFSAGAFTAADMEDIELLPSSKLLAKDNKKVLTFLDKDVEDGGGYFLIQTSTGQKTNLWKLYGSIDNEFMDPVLSPTGNYFLFEHDDSLLFCASQTKKVYFSIPGTEDDALFFNEEESRLLVGNEAGEFSIYDIVNKRLVSTFNNREAAFLARLNPSKTEYLVFTPDGRLQVTNFISNQTLLDTNFALSFSPLSADMGIQPDLTDLYADFSGDGKWLIVKLNYSDPEYNNILFYATSDYTTTRYFSLMELKNGVKTNILPCSLPEAFVINYNGDYLYSVDEGNGISRYALKTGKSVTAPLHMSPGVPIDQPDFHRSITRKAKRQLLAENDTRHLSLSSNDQWLYVLKGTPGESKKIFYTLQVYDAATLRFYRKYTLCPSLETIEAELEGEFGGDTTGLNIIAADRPIYTVNSFRVSESSDGNPARLYLLNEKGNMFTFNLENRTLIEFDSTYSSHPLEFPPGRKLVVSFRGLGYIQVYNWKSEEQLAFFNGHEAPVVNFRFSADLKYAMSQSDDGSFALWQMPALSGNKEGRMLLRNFYFADGSSISLNDEGYYSCSKNAGNNLYYRKDQNIISFGQIDLQYNRPDKVLEAVGCTDTSLINSYRQAYFKRLKKLGIDPSRFNDDFIIPACTIANAATLANRQTTDKVTLIIRATDESGQLDRFQLWINEVPLFGMKGLPVSAAKMKAFDTTVTISLTPGQNKIEAFVTNRQGAESYRMPLQVEYIPTQPIASKTYFVGIGIDSFAQSGHNLRYCVKDIRDLALKLKTYSQQVKIDTLFNQQVTVANVQALKQALLKTTPNDKVILSYSGHGLLSREYDYYLSTYGVNFGHPEQEGLPYEMLESLLDSIPARKKLMLIDACHSGEVDKEEMLHYRQVLRDEKQSGLKGLDIENTDTTSRLGMKNSFELMQELFQNVARGTGATIISAAAGTQLAQEKEELENGTFTFSILEALDADPKITVSKLKKVVSEMVYRLTKGMQRPTTRHENIAVDWPIR